MDVFGQSRVMSDAFNMELPGNISWQSRSVNYDNQPFLVGDWHVSIINFSHWTRFDMIQVVYNYTLWTQQLGSRLPNYANSFRSFFQLPLNFRRFRFRYWAHHGSGKCPPWRQAVHLPFGTRFPLAWFTANEKPSKNPAINEPFWVWGFHGSFFWNFQTFSNENQARLLPCLQAWAFFICRKMVNCMRQLWFYQRKFSRKTSGYTNEGSCVMEK